jgi:hypothetical protein
MNAIFAPGSLIGIMQSLKSLLLESVPSEETARYFSVVAKEVCPKKI